MAKNCKNCSYPLKPEERFCGNCGAKYIVNRLTLKLLINEFASKYFNFDNMFFKTVKHLLTQPKVVIDSFIHGVRKRYINAVSFYAISITLSGLQIFMTKKIFPEQFELPLNAGNAPFVDEMQDYQTLMAFLMVPIYAILSKIIFYKVKSYNYTEHLVIYLYSVAQMVFLLFPLTIGLLLTGMNFYVIYYYLMLLMLIYHFFLLKKTFGISWLKMIWKTILFVLLLFFLILAYGILLYAAGYVEPPTPA